MNSLSHLSEVMEIMATTLGGESTLVIAEGLNPLVLAQKVTKTQTYDDVIVAEGIIRTQCAAKNMRQSRG